MTDYFSNISYLMIETNSSCNLKCVYCNREELKADGHRVHFDITIEQFDKYLEMFEGCKLDTIKIEGISEPMLHPQFDALAEAVRKRFPKAFIIIATNLQYNTLKTKFYKTLKHVDMIYLSIDGIEDRYEMLRPPSKWKKLLGSLTQLKENTNEKEKSKLYINTTVTSENIDDLDEIYNLKEKYELAGVRINLAQNWNENELNSHEYDEAFLKKMVKYRADLKGVAGWDYKDCFWPYSGVIIDVFGNLRQCIINTSQNPITNINDVNIKQFFNESIHYSMVRSKIDKNDSHSSCKNCDYKYLSSKLKYIFDYDEPVESMKPRTCFKEKSDVSEFISTGSSGAQLEILYDRKTLRKGGTFKNESLKFQYDWFNKMQHKSFVPKVHKYSCDYSGANYSMEYFNNAKTLHQLNREDSRQAATYFEEALNVLSEIHQSQVIEPQGKMRDFIQAKGFNKIGSILKKSSFIHEIEKNKDIIINNIAYDNLGVSFDKAIRNFSRIFKDSPSVCLHGDYTLENLLITEGNKLIVIDPNGGNILSNKLVDYSKIQQSISSHYEDLKEGVQFEYEGNRINYQASKKSNYTDISLVFDKKIKNDLNDDETHSLEFFHAINYLRLIPYQIGIKRNKELVFYSKAIEIFSSFNSNF